MTIFIMINGQAALSGPSAAAPAAHCRAGRLYGPQCRNGVYYATIWKVAAGAEAGRGR